MWLKYFSVVYSAGTGTKDGQIITLQTVTVQSSGMGLENGKIWSARIPASFHGSVNMKLQPGVLLHDRKEERKSDILLYRTHNHIQNKTTYCYGRLCYYIVNLDLLTKEKKGKRFGLPVDKYNVGVLDMKRLKTTAVGDRAENRKWGEYFFFLCCFLCLRATEDDELLLAMSSTHGNHIAYLHNSTFHLFVFS